MSSKIHIPRNASEITATWLEEAFREGIKDVKSVEVRNLDTGGTQNGLLSATAKATIIAYMSNGEEEKHPIFVKIMPQREDFQEMITGSNLDVNEIESYKTLLGELIAFEQLHCGDKAKLQSYVPKFYSGGFSRNKDKGDAYYIMLENLSPEYNNTDISKGLTLAQTREALRAVAHLNAVGYCYGKKKQVDFEAKYPFLGKTFTKDVVENRELSEYYDKNVKNLSNDLIGTPNEDLKPSIDIMALSVQKTLQELSLTGKGTFLIHGDSWANNLLFNDKSSVKLIDWQYTSTANVFLDYALTAYISMTPESTEKHEDLLAETYYHVFSDVCQMFQLKPSEVPWTRDQFIKEAKTLGVLFTVFFWAGSYELAETFDGLKERVAWVLRTAIMRTPEYFTKKP